MLEGPTASGHEKWPFVNLGICPLSTKYLLELELHNLNRLVVMRK